MLWFLILAASATPVAEQQISAAPVAAVIDHIALQVADPSVSADFYQRLLGLSPFPQRVSQSMRWLGSETFQLHLFGGRTKPVDTETDTHIAFRVVNLAETLQLLDRNHIKWSSADGVPHTVTTRVDGVLQAYFHDPDGYRIEVNQAAR